MDWPLSLAAVALVAFSVFTLAQATQNDVPGSPNYYVDRQAIYGVLGVIGMFAADPDRLLALPRAAGRHLHLPLRQRLAGLRLRLRRPRLAALLRTSLLHLPAIGARQAPARSGACRVRHRWRQARLADGSARCATSASDWPRLALVFLQPDLGTSLVFVVATLAVMYFGGVPWTHFAVIGAAIVALVALVLVVAPAVGVPILKGYQEERLTSFLHPNEDSGGAGYQQNQAEIAIGSGEIDRPWRSCHPDAARLRSRAAHRLHLCGDR